MTNHVPLEDAIIKTAEHLGEVVYHNYMNGASNQWSGVNLYQIAKVLSLLYSAKVEQIYPDLSHQTHEHFDTLVHSHIC